MSWTKHVKSHRNTFFFFLLYIFYKQQSNSSPKRTDMLGGRESGSRLPKHKDHMLRHGVFNSRSTQAHTDIHTTSVS